MTQLPDSRPVENFPPQEQRAEEAPARQSEAGREESSPGQDEPPAEDVQPIVRADPRARRTALIAGLVMLLVCGAALWWLEGRLRAIRQMVQQNPAAAAQQMMRIVAGVAWAAGAGLVGLGVWLWCLGRRINRTGRFPPPGMRVVRDTRLRTGKQARNLASLAELFAFLAVVAGVVGTWWFYRTVERLVGG